MTGAILFDSYSLQTFDRNALTGIITDHIDSASIPQRVLNLYSLAHSNQSTIPNSNYPSKSITVTGTIAGSSEADLDARLDALRLVLAGRDKNLDITQAGAVRRYTATVNSSNITYGENKKYATFTIEFICIIPFGRDTTNTTALNGTARTLATYTDAYTFLGSAPQQLPVATITLTAVSSTGSQSLTWGNNGTGQGITVTRSTWAAADVVVIDCVNRIVTVNGITVDFSGAFPEFAPGAQNFSYSDTFTSRTMTENVVYAKRYL